MVLYLVLLIALTKTVEKKMSKPFLKWAGGKSQHLKEMSKYFPRSFDRYVEPFLGSGSVFFFLKPSKAFLSDSNSELINTFQMVKDRPEQVINKLLQHENTKMHFLITRQLKPVYLESVERAARFIFLNKTCFNGLYRVNSKNEFNTPFGDYDNPNFCDETTIRVCSKILNNSETEIRSIYFEQVLFNVQENDFVYLDPPYYQFENSKFTNYTRKGFGQIDHEKLAQCFEALSKKNVKLLLSNSDCEWVRNRYKNFEIIELKGKRSINAKGNGRGRVSELLIKNY